MLLFVSVALAVAAFLIPSGRISKTAKSVLSVFMTFCVIAPVFGVIGKNGSGKELLDIFSGFESRDVTENGNALLNDAKERLTEALEGIVVKYTEIPFEISLFADIGEDFVIDIESVRITFSTRPENLDDIAFALEKELGFMPEFVVAEVDNDEKNTTVN